MHSRWLRLLVIIAVFCAFSLSQPVSHAQAQALPPAPAKPDRDAPLLAPSRNAVVASTAEQITDSVLEVEQWSKLVYQSYRDDNWEIYLAKGDGSAPVNLTLHRKADVRPQLNFGATSVAFVSDRNGKAEIYTVNTDGSGLARLTNNKAADFAPTWSPDNSRILFVSDRTGNNELWVMNADGSAPVQLTYDVASDSSPAWSPDGQRIVWKQTNEVGISSFMVMRPDGTGVASLSSALRFAGDIHWSPAGDSLIFDADFDLDNWNELIELRWVNGRWDVRRLFDANQPLVDAWAGTYAPDGRSMTFTLVQYVAYEGALYLGRSDILRLDLNTGALSLFRGSGTEMNPNWMGEDTAAPTSQVLPLPEYVRFGRVPIPLEGIDKGPSGVKNYDVQCALGAEGPWFDVASNANPGEAYSDCGQLDSTIWLRSRAKDYAGNIEAWPPAADTHTRYFVWSLQGQVVDNRGIALPKHSIVSEPAAPISAGSDVSGDYRLLYTTAQTYTLSATASGYGRTLPASLNLNADARVNFFLPPQTDLIQNGSFEDGATGWTGDGTVVEGNAASSAHAGYHGLALGADCPLTCLSAALVPTTDTIGTYKVVSDARGNFHVLFGGTGANARLRYFVHSLDTGLWSEPEILPPLPPVTQYLVGFALDGQGVAHVVVALHDLDIKSWFALWHAQRGPGGAWTEFTKFGEGGSEALVIGDPVAGLHVLVAGRYYYRLKPDGGWLPVVDICDGELMTYTPTMTIAVTNDGAAHFVGECKYKPAYRMISTQGVLSGRVALDGDGLAYWRMVAGPQQTLHVLRSTAYVHRGEDGVWTRNQAYVVGEQYPDARLFSNHADRLSIIGRAAGLFYNYIVKTPDAGWLPPQKLNNVDVRPDTISVAPNGIIQLLAVGAINEFIYQSSPVGSTGTVTSAAQVVTLPAQMVHPTLSFFHKATSGDPQGQARLSVIVDEGLGATEVLSTPAATAWTQGWVDMEPWLGKTVTVTFAVEQADAEPLLSVYLDDISLGPWTTPQIQAVTPAQLYAEWTGEQITVHGDNFTAGSILRLGETTLATSFSDEHTLRATLPAGLAAGRHDLWVENPDGQQTVALGGLILGGWDYLPAIRK